MAVHVSALRVAAVVARYDTVWVDNWHDPEFKLVSKLIGERILGYKKVQEPMDDERRVGLS